jgi:RNA polymerase sigma factor (sigma-70 family)
MSRSQLQRYVEDGDADAFRELTLTYQNLVYGTCRRILRNASDVEDAVQETFVKLARNAKQIRAHPGAWLHVCARTTALNVLKAQKVRREREIPLVHDASTARGNVASADSDRDEESSIVDACLSELPEADRELVVSYFFVSRSQHEIADEVGVSRVAITKRIDRVLETLRSRLLVRGLGVTGVMAAFLADLGAQTETPPALATKIAALQPTTVTAARSALVAKSAIAGAKLLPVWLAAVVVMVAAGTAVLWHDDRANEAASLGQAQSHSARYQRTWTFDTPDATVGGESWRWKNDGDGGYLESAGIASGEFKIPDQILSGPLLITARILPVSPDAPALLHSFLKLPDYSRSTVDPWRIPQQAGKWTTIRRYVTTDWVDIWADGEHIGFALTDPQANDSGFMLFTTGGLCIDDLTIEAIDVSDLPDVHEFLEMAAEMARDVNLPKPTPLPNLKSYLPAHVQATR